jgi:hypothetical protein
MKNIQLLLCLALALSPNDLIVLIAQSKSVNEVNANLIVQQKEARSKWWLLRTKEDSLNWKIMREFIGDKKWYTKQEWDSLMRGRARTSQPMPRTPLKKRIKKNMRHTAPQQLQKDSTSTKDTTSSVNSSPIEDLGTKDIRSGSESVAEPMISVNPTNSNNSVTVYTGVLNPDSAMASSTREDEITGINGDTPSPLNRYAYQNDPVVAFDGAGNCYMIGQESSRHRTGRPSPSLHPKT